MANRRNDPHTIELMDTTLRDGEQTPDVAYSPAEKLQLARLLLGQRVAERQTWSLGIRRDDLLQQAVVERPVEDQARVLLGVEHLRHQVPPLGKLQRALEVLPRLLGLTPQLGRPLRE